MSEAKAKADPRDRRVDAYGGLLERYGDTENKILGKGNIHLFEGAYKKT